MEQQLSTLVMVMGNNLFDQLPSEIMELLFSFIPFKESYNFRISSRMLLSSFVNYFRRVMRERLSDYNAHLKEQFDILPCDDGYLGKYEREIVKVQDELNCKIPFLLKELLLITKHIDSEMDTTVQYSKYSYPIHWINPIKLWKREGSVVKVGESLSLIPDGKYNNIILSTGEYLTKIDLWKSLFNPFSSIFNIERDSFPKYCEIACGRQLVARLNDVVSLPLALCMLEHFTAIDISPQQIEKVINSFSNQLWNNKDFLVKAAKIFYKIGKNIPKALFEDRDFCMRLVKSHGKMLKYCTKFLTDKGVVLQAVKQNGFSIKYVSPQFLRSLPGVYEHAIESNPHSLNYFPKSIPGYRQMVIKVLKLIESMNSIPTFVNDLESLQDKEIVEIIVMKNPYLIEQLPKMWKESIPLAKKVCSISPDSIYYFPSKVQKDPRILKMIMEKKPSAILHLEIPEQQLFKHWDLPLPNNENYEEIMSSILQLARRNHNIYGLILSLPCLTRCYDNSIRNKWCLNFIKEGLSQKEDNVICGNIRQIVHNLTQEEQEEIIKFLISNPIPVSHYYFSAFKKELLKKYELEALKNGIKFSDNSYVLASNPDDVVECVKNNKDCYYLCVDKEEYERKCKL